MTLAYGIDKDAHEQVKRVIAAYPAYGITFPRPDIVSVKLADGDDATAVQIQAALELAGLLKE